jgi:hypothetical protein
MHAYLVLSVFISRPSFLVSNTVYMFLFKVYNHSQNYDHLTYEQPKLQPKFLLKTFNSDYYQNIIII